jgi:hypothetical protein
VRGNTEVLTPQLAMMHSHAARAHTLAAHNPERQNYPAVGPLQWSPELAAPFTGAAFLLRNNLSRLHAR